jgi:hypothetical protein
LSLQHVDDGAETDAIKYDLLLADLLRFFYESTPSLPGKIDAGLRDFGDHVICHSDILTVQTKASRTEHFHDKYQQLSLKRFRGSAFTRNANKMVDNTHLARVSLH